MMVVVVVLPTLLLVTVPSFFLHESSTTYYSCQPLHAHTYLLYDSSPREAKRHLLVLVMFSSVRGFGVFLWVSGCLTSTVPKQTSSRISGPHALAFCKLQRMDTDGQARGVMFNSHVPKP